MIAATRRSAHAEFWPSGWLVWLCWALAAFDVSLIAYLFRLVVLR